MKKINAIGKSFNLLRLQTLYHLFHLLQLASWLRFVVLLKIQKITMKNIIFSKKNGIEKIFTWIIQLVFFVITIFGCFNYFWFIDLYYKHKKLLIIFVDWTTLTIIKLTNFPSRYDISLMESTVAIDSWCSESICISNFSSLLKTRSHHSHINCSPAKQNCIKTVVKPLTVVSDDI